MNDKAIVCKCQCNGAAGEHDCSCLTTSEGDWVKHRCYPPAFQKRECCDSWRTSGKIIPWCGENKKLVPDAVEEKINEIMQVYKTAALAAEGVSLDFRNRLDELVRLARTGK